MSSDNPEPLLWLRGRKAALGPFSRELVEKYWEWEQDPRVIIGYGRQTPESLESRIEGYASQARSMGNQERFTVYDLTADDGPRPVGTTALRIDHYVRTAEYVILLGSEGRGRGLATDATWLTLDYGFHITQLRAIWLKVLEHNTAAIRAYQAAGFKEVGRLRRSGYWLGAECDEIIMDTVSDEFPGPSVARGLVEG
ncbi:MAG: GNAT family N-acetyltransferase [Pseudonocardiaceae bacterium]